MSQQSRRNTMPEIEWAPAEEDRSPPNHTRVGFPRSKGQKQPMRSFTFDGKEVRIIQEVDEHELGAKREGMGEYGGVGMVVWKAGPCLADFLIAHYGSKLRGLSCLELGAGTGVVGIAMALQGASVVATDLDHITPLLTQNVELNILNSTVSNEAGEINVVSYRWGEEPPPALDHQRFDVIFAADVLYQRELHPFLADAIRRFSNERTVTYVMTQDRRKGEASFESLARARFGLTCQRINEEEFLSPYHKGFAGRFFLLRLGLEEPELMQRS